MAKQKWILNLASMMSKNILVPGFSFSWHRLLRRTLVRSVRYSTTYPCPSLLRFARNDGEGMQTHSPRFSKTLLFLLQILNCKASAMKKTFRLSGSVHQQAPFRGFGGFRVRSFVLLCAFVSLWEMSSAQQATWI